VVDVNDVVALVRRDHESIKEGFSRLVRRGVDSPDLFLDLANRLIRHEVAEEIVVYPAIRSQLEGEQLAQARLAEQSEIENQLYSIERVGFDEAVLQSELADIWSLVFDHSEREEAEVLPLLNVTLTLAKRIELGHRYAEVRDTAPNRPHPHAGADPIANPIIGPMAAMADWIRDCARSALWQPS
jgi:hypothetical protein